MSAMNRAVGSAALRRTALMRVPLKNARSSTTSSFSSFSTRTNPSRTPFESPITKRMQSTRPKRPTSPEKEEQLRRRKEGQNAQLLAAVFIGGAFLLFEFRLAMAS